METRVVLARTQRVRGLTWLLSLSAVANLAAAIPTVLLPNLLSGPAVLIGSARGTALIMLVLGVPLLVASLALERAGSRWWAIVRYGSLAYLAYNDFLLLFGMPFNSLFLVYIVAMSTTAFALGLGLAHADREAVRVRLPGTAARVIGGYILTIVLLNTLLWLRTIVPAILANEPTSFLAGTGITTNPIFVQDLVFWLPTAAFIGWLAWTRRPWGALLAGSYLVYGLVEAIGVATDQWMGSSADPSSQVATMGAVGIFAVMTILGIVALTYSARSLDAGAGAVRSVPQLRST
jgi:hypothetical protein